MIGERMSVKVASCDPSSRTQYGTWHGMVRKYVLWHWPVVTYHCWKRTQDECLVDVFNVVNSLFKEQDAQR